VFFTPAILRRGSSWQTFQSLKLLNDDYILVIQFWGAAFFEPPLSEIDESREGFSFLVVVVLVLVLDLSSGLE
jgi:hypothetical protein